MTPIKADFRSFIHTMLQEILPPMYHILKFPVETIFVEHTVVKVILSHFCVIIGMLFILLDSPYHERE